MILKADMHMHSTRSDGNADIFEMGKAAFERGFRLIGFSDHAWVVHPDGTHGFGIKEEELDAYINDVYTLRDMYRGRMDVLCGFEAENTSGTEYIDAFQDSQLNYLIGSTHTIIKDGEGLDVDYSEEVFKEDTKKCYGGDYYAYVRDYYETVSQVTERIPCDIIGHLDLITKFNQDGKLFDESSPAYLKPALECLDRLMETDPLFEINTGAMSRGCRKEPYPSRRLLEELRKRNAKLTLNSDAHDPLCIGYWFEEALKLAWDCGFRKLSYVTPEGIRDFDIQD